ncbi:DUF2946 domain-containing protein [Undibacterium danionis]|uniref:DUF2946 domain-containing protein n=1 Tax=Undibacterium danionis TaxID=1812100 RepID=A0ABV6IAN0_9BURK
MWRSQIHQRLFSWIAILAILLNSLMPLISQAVELQTGNSFKPSSSFVAADGANWQELCSANGSVWIKLDANGNILEKTKEKPAGAPSTIHLEHCAYCLTHAGSFALAVTDLVYAFAQSELDQFTAVDFTPDLPQSFWISPAVRAPPTFAS